MSTPLHIALSSVRDEENLVNILIFLTEAGADVNVEDKSCCTPLYLAVKRGSLNIVQILLDAGAKDTTYEKWRSRRIFREYAISTHREEEKFPLMDAISYGYSDIAERLIKVAGSNVNVENSFMNYSALLVACSRGDERVAKILIEAGADMEHKDIWGRTVLMWSVSRGQENIVRLLIHYKANIEAKDSHHYTSLFLVRGTSILKMLLEAGADTEARDKEKWETPLIHLACFPNYVRLLIYYGANVNARRSGLETALMVAAKKGVLESAELLLQNGADTEIESDVGATALMYAVKEQQEEIVRLLLQYGANVDAKDWYGGSVLQRARYGDSDEIYYLIVEHMRKEGWCFLSRAIKRLVRRNATRRTFHVLETTSIKK